MLQTIITEFNSKNNATEKKAHRRRFGIIPAEPCRASSMQVLRETPCAEQMISDSNRLA